jgi:hypothetical protein
VFKGTAVEEFRVDNICGLEKARPERIGTRKPSGALTRHAGTCLPSSTAATSLLTTKHVIMFIDFVANLKSTVVSTEYRFDSSAAAQRSMLALVR